MKKLDIRKEKLKAFFMEVSNSLDKLGDKELEKKMNEKLEYAIHYIETKPFDEKINDFGTRLSDWCDEKFDERTVNKMNNRVEKSFNKIDEWFESFSSEKYINKYRDKIANKVDNFFTEWDKRLEE